MQTITTPAGIYTPPATALIQKVQLRIFESCPSATLCLMQYDRALPVIAVELFEGGNPYKVPENAAVNIRMVKPDKTTVYNPALGVSSDRKTTYIGITPQMTACFGSCAATLEIALNDGVLGTGLLRLNIEKNPVSEDAVESSDEYLSLQEIVNKVQTYADQASTAAESAEAAADLAMNSVQAVVSVNAQNFTKEQKAQARENIGAAAVGEGGGEVGDITWDDISVTYGDTLTWDGNTTGLPNAMGMVFKVSEAVPTVEDLQKGFSVRTNLGDSMEFPAGDTEEIAVDGIIAMNIFFVVPPEMAGVESEAIGLAFPEAGTYFTVMDGIYLTELRINGYNGFGTEEKIPVDRLPLDEIGGVANWDAAEDESGYILNKPFGNDREIIFPKFELPVVDGTIPFHVQKDPVLGNMYKVVWNGVEYNCLATELGEYIVFVYEGGYENAPFDILSIPGAIVVTAKDGSTNVTLEIYRDYVKKLDSEFLPESGVTAGKYGSYSGGYYFPIVTVDAYGRITAASEAVIPNVNNGMGDNGLMPYTMYSHIANGSHITHVNSNITVGGEATMILGDCATTNIYVSGVGYTAFPKVYGAYVYTYGDVDKRTRYWVPVDPKFVKYACSGDSMSTASITATAVVSLPEEYREYYAEGDSVPVLVIYEKVYGSSSSVM